MKRFLLILVTAFILTSCGVPKYLKKDYRPVRDYSERMELLQKNFPEVYNLYRNGEVVIEDMYEYTDRNGHPQVHISYYYRNRRY